MREMLAGLREIFDRSAKIKLVLATGGSVVVALLDTVAIALVLPLVDLATGAPLDQGVVGVLYTHLGEPSRSTLTVILALAVVVLFIVKDVGQLCFSWWMSGFIFTERVLVSARILRYYLTAPYARIAPRSTAELVRGMDTAVMQVFNFTVNGLMYAVSGAIAVAAVVITLAVVAPLPTLAVLVYFGVAGLIYTRVVKPRAAHAGQEMTEASLAGWRTALAAIGGLKEIRLRGAHEYFLQRYLRAALRGARSGRTASFLTGLPRYVLEVLFILAIGIVLILGAQQAGSGGALGVLALFVAAGFRILPSISQLLANLSAISVGAEAVEIVRTEVRAARQSESSADDRHRPVSLERSIRLVDVHFSYPGSEEEVLKGVDLEIPKGASVAFVGGSGAGKTTLLDIIVGLYAPTSGTVFIDDTDLQHVTGGWQDHVGYVSQDVYVLEGTLAENVAFDVPADHIEEDRLRTAVEQAQLADVVAELPDGVNTELGERGARLSGGQRQRVGIARALYRRPQLLGLDEATASLDNETEHALTQTLRNLTGLVTTIVVAHRLSTVRHVDVVVFLKDGRVSATGTFEEVQAREPDFARLVALASLDGPSPVNEPDAGEPILEDFLDDRPV